jgi:GDPmannose 4,6-dehydratase
MKKALITGITGQDGSYLSKLLLDKGYEVVGLTRSYSQSNLYKLDYLDIKDEVILRECDLLDLSNVLNIIKEIMPNEIYNLSAQSSVGNSFSQPIGTFNYNTISVLNILESIKILDKDIKFYQASSSDMFGETASLPITEETPMNPVSPYAVSKVSAHLLTKTYRESYSLFASCGILFNHESYLRSQTFFIKKVIQTSIDIAKGKQDTLSVGNIDIKRDFGYSPKYVEAMYLILQQDSPDDFIICSGKSVTLRDIINHTFDRLNISKDRLIIDEKFYRPSEIPDIYGSNQKAKQKLGWEYDYDFIDVLDILIDEEIRNEKL